MVWLIINAKLDILYQKLLFLIVRDQECSSSNRLLHLVQCFRYRTYFQYLAHILILYGCFNKEERIDFYRNHGIAHDHMQMAELRHGAQSFDKYVILLYIGCYITDYQNYSRDFPRGPVGRTLGSQCREPGIRELDPTCCS